MRRSNFISPGRAKIPTVVFVLGLLTAAALAQPPDVTVQIADAKDTAGNWANWTDLEVTWGEERVGEVPPHNPQDDDTLQDWYVPMGGEFFHFSFKRTQAGLYAIRCCYGKSSAVSAWSPVAECKIVVPAQAVHKPSLPLPRVLRDGSDPPGAGVVILVRFPSSIQAAIDAARDGDTIIVGEGAYLENINFRGKAIAVRSEDPEDPSAVAATIIDGGARGSAVTFNSGEGENSVLTGFTITNGRADWGGGIFCATWTSPTIRNNRIVRNVALKGGGGIYCAHSATISRNMISSNQSQRFGGGIFADVSTKSIIASNFIVKNNAAFSGGGIFFGSFCTCKVINNTIADNFASVSGGGLYCDFLATPQTWNCILWGNGDDIYAWGGFYCCVENTGGENEWKGNIHANPLFVNPALGDYHLLSSSPCIGSGSTDGPYIPAFDFDGEPIIPKTVDIGADEFVDFDSDTLPDFWEKRWLGGLAESEKSDPDSDQLPNRGELLSGTKPNNPDTDADGCPDGVESFAGTDPLDPTSSFRIVAVSSSEPWVTLRWTTVPGRWYQAYFSENLHSWATVGPPLKATGNFLQSGFSFARPASPKFFCIGVLP